MQYVQQLIYLSKRTKESLNDQASTLTQNGTGPVEPVTPRIYWSCKDFSGPTNFSLTYKEKFTDSIYLYLFYLHLFQKHLGYS